MNPTPYANYTFGGYLADVPTFAVLRSIPGAAGFDRASTRLACAQTTDGDGMGAIFKWSPTSLDDDDNVNVIKPFDLTDQQPGRWILSVGSTPVANVIDMIDAISATVNDPTIGNVTLGASINEETTLRLTGDQALAQQVSTLGTTVTTNYATLSSEISTNATSQTDATQALATRTTTLETNYTALDSTLTAAITNEETARSSADSSMASEITTLTAQMAGSQGSNLQSQITTNAQVSTSADSALATRVTNLESGATGGTAAVYAAITTEQDARISGDTALSDQITTLTTTVGSNSSSITSFQNSINGLEAQTGLTLDVNGYVTGYTQFNNGHTSSFIVNANTFEVITPGNSGVIPFSVINGVVTINSVPVNTLSLNTAMIPTRVTATAPLWGTAQGTGTRITSPSQVLLSCTITMPTAGYIECSATAWQATISTATAWPWSFLITCNGVNMAESVIIAMIPQESISTQGSIYVGAGTYTFNVLWDAYLATEIQSRTLFVKGFPFTG